MKRILACLLILVLALSAVGCGAKGEMGSTGLSSKKPAVKIQMDTSVTIQPQVVYEDENVTISAEALYYDLDGEEKVSLSMKLENKADLECMLLAYTTINNWSMEVPFGGPNVSAGQTGSFELNYPLADLQNRAIFRIDQCHLRFKLFYGDSEYHPEGDLKLDNAHPREVSPSQIDGILADRKKASSLGLDVQASEIVENVKSDILCLHSATLLQNGKDQELWLHVENLTDEFQEGYVNGTEINGLYFSEMGGLVYLEPRSHGWLQVKLWHFQGLEVFGIKKLEKLGIFLSHDRNDPEHEMEYTMVLGDPDAKISADKHPVILENDLMQIRQIPLYFMEEDDLGVLTLLVTNTSGKDMALWLQGCYVDGESLPVYGSSSCSLRAGTVAPMTVYLDKVSTPEMKEILKKAVSAQLQIQFFQDNQADMFSVEAALK